MSLDDFLKACRAELAERWVEDASEPIMREAVDAIARVLPDDTMASLVAEVMELANAGFPPAYSSMNYAWVEELETFDSDLAVCQYTINRPNGLLDDYLTLATTSLAFEETE